MSNDETRKAEARDESTATVEFRGLELTVARNYDDWSIDFIEAFEDGRAVGIIRGALGPEQWAEVRQFDLKGRDLNELGDKIAVAMGFKSVGEYTASSD